MACGVIAIDEPPDKPGRMIVARLLASGVVRGDCRAQLPGFQEVEALAFTYLNER
jgi:hypothetical protein